ncbi:MAG: SnoaL-like domain-containing protein [Rhodothermales bacterium]
MSVRANLDEMNSMILSGQILDAFDKFYADNVAMQENNDEPRLGKAVNRTYEEAFVNGLTAFRGAEVKALAVNEEDGVAMVQWWMDFTHKDYGDVNRHQVSVQRWENGQIVHERFFYG